MNIPFFSTTIFISSTFRSSTAFSSVDTKKHHQRQHQQQRRRRCRRQQQHINKNITNRNKKRDGLTDTSSTCKIYEFNDL